MNKQALVERLLYVLLFMMVASAAVAVFYLINFDDKLNRELQSLKTLEQQNTQLNQHISQAVAELKQDNSRGLTAANDHINCIVLFFATPNRLNKSLQGCNVVDTPTSKPTAQGSTSTPSQQPAQSTSTHSSAPSPQPQPQPQPSALQKTQKSVTNVVDNLLRSL